MSTRILLAGSLILGLLACSPYHRPESDQNGWPSAWDLSYSSLIKTNNLDDEVFLVKWLNRTKAPSKETLLNLMKDTESAILLEYPAIRAGERLTFLFARGLNGALCWTFIDGRPKEIEKPINPTSLDLLVEHVGTWQQEPPQTEEFLPGSRGYFGMGLLPSEWVKIVMEQNDCPLESRVS